MATYAIVIGCQTYEDPGVPPLRTPVEDALRMAAWLETKGGVAPDKLLLLLSPVVKDAAGGRTTVGETLTQLGDDRARFVDVLNLPSLDKTLVRLGTDRARFADTLRRISAFGKLRMAARADILTAIREISTRAAGGGERLYVYYSGHGLACRITFSEEDAIVPQDYADGINKAISVSSIVRFFQSLKFPEQFIFLDCCRNRFPLTEQMLESAPPPLPRDLSLRAPDQFIYNSTSPGIEALDGGLLTDALIDGLLGEGRAKNWLSPQKKYVVRAVRLFDYIGDRFAANPALVATNQVQEPRFSGERNRDRVIVEIEENTLGEVDLDVMISPDAAWPVAELTLLGDGQKVRRRGVRGVEERFRLKPRTYTLAVDAGDGWDTGDGAWSIELFDTMKWPVILNPAVPAGAGAGGTGGASTPSGPVGAAAGEVAPAGVAPPATRSASPDAPEGADAAAVSFSFDMAAPEEGPAPAAGPPVAPGLTVKTDDPLAPLELLHADGTPATDDDGRSRIGLGTLECSGLEPGYYRVRLTTPEGPRTERTVEVVAGAHREFTLPAPRVETSGLMRDLADRVGLKTNNKNFFELSEKLAAVVAPALSTVLALSSSATHRAWGWEGAGDRLRRIGLGPAAGATGVPKPEALGVEVLLAAEMSPAPFLGARGDAPGRLVRLDSREKIRDYLQSLELRVTPFVGEPGPAGKAVPAEEDGIAWFAAPAAPGPYWLEIKSPTQGVAAFAIVVLEGRTTQVVLHQGSNGEIHSYQFMPVCLPDAPADRDVLRRLDLAQRFLHTGHALEATVLLEPLLEAGRFDPIAGCLGAHLRIKERQTDHLASFGELMAETFPTLPDSHLLVGLNHEAAGRTEQAAGCYRTALGHGLPVTASLTRSLSGGVARLKIEHPRVPLLERLARHQVAGALWTAWMIDQEGNSRPHPDALDGPNR